MKKQAYEIADQAIAKARQESRVPHKDGAELRARLEQQHLAREADGGDALSNLARLGSRKLPSGDEIIIARHLYAELPALKARLRERGIGIGQFCIDAGISDSSQSSRELHRLMLPPDRDPAAVRLRRSADKYKRVIEALSQVMHESASCLADRLLRGTSLHPSDMENLNETELVQAALQGIANRIDEQFGLYEKFMEIARLKAKHLSDGGREFWPLSPPIGIDEPSLRAPVAAPSNDADTCDEQEGDQEPWTSNPEISEMIAAFRKNPELNDQRVYPADQELLDTLNPAYAFWRRQEFPLGYLHPYGDGWPLSQGSGALQDESFFFIPHAPLGVIEFANLPDRREHPLEYHQAVKRSIEDSRRRDPQTGNPWIVDEYASIKDDWNDEANCPEGQFAFNRGREFAWIVIYPMPSSSKLMPMLYVSYEEGGPYLLPLDARNLDIFRDALWLGEDSSSSVFDRIKALLGYQDDGLLTLENAFRRTAPWLDQNPFFRMQRAHDEDLARLREYCRGLWSARKD